MSHLKRHSIYYNKTRTSVSLEDEFWTRFVGIAQNRGTSINSLVREVNNNRRSNLSSAIRVFVLSHACAVTT